MASRNSKLVLIAAGLVVVGAAASLWAGGAFDPLLARIEPEAPRPALGFREEPPGWGARREDGRRGRFDLPGLPRGFELRRGGRFGAFEPLRLLGSLTLLGLGALAGAIVTWLVVNSRRPSAPESPSRPQPSAEPDQPKEPA